MIIGTRSGELALRQGQLVRQILAERAGLETLIKVSRTVDDVLTDVALNGSEGEGFSRGELESALLAGEVDLVVFPVDQLSPLQPEGVVVGAVPYRGERRDFVVIRRAMWEERAPLGLRIGARLGFHGTRCHAQVHDLRPDVELASQQGDISSRLRRLSDKHLDAVILPGFALELLEVTCKEFAVCKLPPSLMVPAPGQGAIAVECREEDVDAVNTCALIQDAHIAGEIDVERQVMARMQSVPEGTLGAYCEQQDHHLHLWVFLGSEDSQRGESIRGNFAAQSAEEVVSTACEFLAGGGSEVEP